MMAQTVSGLLFIFLCFFFVSKFVGANQNRTYIYAVPTTPFDGNESMAVSCTESECYTLQELSSGAYNFTSNSALVLLPGVHNVTTNCSLDIANLKNFSILGYEESNKISRREGIPVIQCSNSGIFSFNLKHIAGLWLTRFEIYDCSRYGGGRGSILISNSANLTIDKVYVYNSRGISLDDVHNNVQIQDSEFLHNWGINFEIELDGTDLESALAEILGINSNSIITLTIANTVFKNKGKMSISIIAGPYQTYKVYIHNVTLLQQIDGTELHSGIELKLSSNYRKTSIVNIKELQVLISINDTKRLLRMISSLQAIGYCSNFNMYHHIGGLSIISLGGKMQVTITDSNFTGYGSCVRMFTNVGLARDRFMAVHLSNTAFTNVHCDCGPLRMENVNHVELHDIIITNSSQSLRFYQCNVTIHGNFLFQRNDGSLLLYKHSTLFIGIGSIVEFEDNHCSMNNSMHCPIFEVESSNILIFQNTSMLFRNNSGTGVFVLHNSNLAILGNTSIVFDSNCGKNGGALSLYARSQVKSCSKDFNEYYPDSYSYDDLYWTYPSELRWLYSSDLVKRCASHNKHILLVNNHASGKGGALFIDNSYFSPLVGLDQSQLNAFEQNRLDKLKIDFINNTADIAGSALYGGWIVYNLGIIPARKTLNFYGEQENVSMISSNPVRVCVCISSVPDCNITEYQIKTYPGRTIYLDVIAVGQSYGIMSSIVHTELTGNSKNSETTLNEAQFIQEASRSCTKLQYNIFSSNKKEGMMLTVDRENTPDLDSLQDSLKYPELQNEFLYNEIGILKQQLTVLVTFTDCPLGFFFNYTSKKCSCHPILNSYQTFDCDIETLRIMKPSQKWINATFIHNLDNDTGVIVNDHCPFDYCKQNTTHISLVLELPDDQCDFNRSGILCGGCRTNFSHVLGTSKCKKCSSLWTILLVLVVAIVGVLLIVTMLGLNLSVSTGMLNGLILFANIVRANHSTFFNSNSFLSYFIAWLNLDLGIEICFYNGLDAYVKIWLQFIFPLYIWTIMIILIALSRRYVFVVRLCGSNVVQVLATLFLLSYAKLIRTIITIFQFTTLVYPDGYKRRMWLYDGNVDYLRGKHIPLFIAGLLVLLFLSIPYTVSLLFIQWLRKYNHHKLLRWVGKLKPLFDAYTGPFKEKHCYWFGVLLLVRVALYLVFSLNVSGDTSLNLMAIGTTALCIFSYLVLVGGVYESTLANVADVSFMLNLGILTMGAHFYNNPQGTSTVSVSIAFCQFILITLYHLYLRITETRKGRQWNETLQTKLKQIFTSQRVVSMREYFAPPVRARTNITHHSIELKEPLLVDVTANTHK